MPSADQRVVGGIPVHPLALPEVVRLVAARATARPPFGIIATVNLDFLRLARADERFHSLLRERTLFNIADGWPVKWFARSPDRAAHRTTGSDLVPQLLRDDSVAAHGVYLLGDTTDTLADVQRRGQAEGWLRAIAGAHSPTANEVARPEESLALVERINASGAATLLVALGAPRQEFWMDRWREHLAPATGIGVGGAFRFLADPTRRAPHWLQQLGLEWMHRLAREPTRLGRRYAADMVEFARLLLHPDR
jgi:N-acetylglucosaminyldiphosphoundecaprenol N-acetyl-beta-D-mannosaminyltransferase